MGEMSTAEFLPVVMIGAAVGTVFGIWRIVGSTRGQRGWPLRRGGPGPVSEEFPGVRSLRARSGAPLARRPSKKTLPAGL